MPNQTIPFRGLYALDQEFYENTLERLVKSKSFELPIVVIRIGEDGHFDVARYEVDEGAGRNILNSVIKSRPNDWPLALPMSVIFLDSTGKNYWIVYEDGPELDDDVFN